MQSNTVFSNILDFGAVAGTDCTDAFEKSIAAGQTVYVPKGRYLITRPLVLFNQNMIGDGLTASQIEMVGPEEHVILYAGRSCSIEKLALGYAPELITGHEVQGERVGIATSANTYPLQRGSALRDVRIHHTGTALYSSDDGEQAASFSVTYDTLEIDHFSFRGVDFSCKVRTGNVFSNIYINSPYKNVDCLFYFEGEESETSIHQLNLEHTQCRRAMYISGACGLVASTIHLEGILLRDKDAAFIEINNSNVNIGTLSVYYSGIYQPDLSLFLLGDNNYHAPVGNSNHRFETAGALRIGNLHLKGLNNPHAPIHGAVKDGLLNEAAANFSFFRRRNGASGEYRVCVDDFIYFTFQKDAAEYENFPSHGSILFAKKGAVAAFGPTGNRPVTRLCPYVSRYFDTDIQKELLYTGTGWTIL